MPDQVTQHDESGPVYVVRQCGQPQMSDPSAYSTSKPGDLDTREQRLFRSLDTDNDGHIHRTELAKTLAKAGLREDDQRLKESLAILSVTNERNGQAPTSAENVSERDFCAAIRHNILLIERALQGELVIPDFSQFTAEIDAIHQQTRENREGQAADYIPQLAVVGDDLDRFGVSVCTTDGQRHDIGDYETTFSVQSTCKPINYCLALEEHGHSQVHRFVGHEPSGASFNELTLDRKDRPHNPMLNAGGIMTSALIKLREKQERMENGEWSKRDCRGWAGARFEHVLRYWQELCGGHHPQASLSTYLSERQTADRNFALGYYMQEKHSFPEASNLEDVLEFFFQCCSIEMNTRLMSVVAGTLANGGICPVTGERVFRTETVRSCLAVMSSCGMYDYSGEFAFTIGLPAKSGVSGAVLVVIPNVAGFCVWSPRLDENGNSVRGIEFCIRLIEKFNFHNFDSLANRSDKSDPRERQTEQRAARVSRQIWAASKGDLNALQQQWSYGADLSCADYDGRTPLHLAAVEGQQDVVEFLVGLHRNDPASMDLSAIDRWGQTPLDEAACNGHQSVVNSLKAAGATGARSQRARNVVNFPIQTETSNEIDMIWAASIGDLDLVRRLVARGMSLTAGDYDSRTPLHLSAAEGHLPVVHYLIDHRVPLNVVDRWGHTALDEAIRHERKQVVQLLRQRNARTGRVLADCRDES